MPVAPFTLLHELGHHLLAIDDEWNYDVVPLLAQTKTARNVEERIVNAFAATTLIPDEVATKAFRQGVNAAAARNLYLSTNASATACLSRALLEDGDRLVLLATTNGRVWYTQSNGEPYAPGKAVEQLAIAHGAERAAAGDGTARFTGHEGIRCASGKVNTRVAFDICVHDELVFAMVTPTLHDARVDGAVTQFSLTCTAGCGTSFVPSESPGRCSTCSENRCPRCSGCDCAKDVYCARCTIALPTARARIGATLCEDCE